MIATTWGFVESLVCSISATLTFNFFFLQPVGTLTIADPQNWVALFSFLTTALIASRLSDKAKRRALDAIERQQDVERLYTFSRAILLIDGAEPFPKQLLQKLAEIFELSAAVLYDRRTESSIEPAHPISKAWTTSFAMRRCRAQLLPILDEIASSRRSGWARSRSRVSRCRARKCRIPCCKASRIWLPSGWNARERRTSRIRSKPRGKASNCERRSSTPWRTSSRRL